MSAGVWEKTHFTVRYSTGTIELEGVRNGPLGVARVDNGRWRIFVLSCGLSLVRDGLHSLAAACAAADEIAKLRNDWVDLTLLIENAEALHELSRAVFAIIQKHDDSSWKREDAPVCPLEAVRPRFNGYTEHEQ